MYNFPTNKIPAAEPPSSGRTWNISKIRGKSVGEVLEETRREQNLTVEAAADAVNIHPNHLRALEAGDYSKLPGGIYSEKILENYANFLDIDLEGLKRIFDKERKANQPAGKQAFTPKISPKNFIVTPRIIEIGVISIIVVLFLVYLGFEINNIFSPPPLSVSAPLDNSATSQSTVEIIGQTKKEVTVKINDQEIQTDADGNFRESVGLQPGLNIIKISAAKKRSRENVIYRQVILNE